MVERICPKNQVLITTKEYKARHNDVHAVELSKDKVLIALITRLIMLIAR